MVPWQLFQNFGIALALGALIGLEREYARYKRIGHAYAGIRTFPLISLFGALCAYLSDVLSPWILLAGMLLVGGVILIAYFSVASHQRKYVGATSEMAGFLAFFIGVLAYRGEFLFATITTVVIASILYLRSILHNVAKHLKPEEMADTLKFAIIAFVILPLLPNRWYGPWEGLFNPYILWLMVVFISGISFIGYLLMKWLGERGITWSGIVGGIVSSMAVTLSFTHRSKKEKTIYRSLALGVILANGIMFLRILVEVLVLNRTLFVHLLFPLLLLAVSTAGFSYFLWRQAKKVKGKVKLGSPFTLLPALKFAGIFALTLVLIKIAKVYLSSQGVYVVSFVSGLADVDAIAVGLAQLGGADIALDVARNGIVIAALANIATKGMIAYWFGGKEFGKIILRFYIGLVALGLAMVLLL
ncbi:MgtC/SapB family protein [Candidatus Woesearchaeota archaeon]|nr:MgtC/SapB family protein [Candidatus Woesearchaeota archaeon]